MIVERCVNCMEDMENSRGTVCSYCGYDNAGEDNEQRPYAIKCNTILHGRYLIGRVLGQGGFGITYIGFDLVLNVKIAVKEYFPMGIATREHSNSNTLLWNSSQMNTQQRQSGYENFLKEARKTAKIDQIPSIVRVRDTFFENETAYIVMDYVDGVTLKNKLLKDGAMSISDCIRLLTPMMEGLAQVHQLGMIHRDISPDNIMIQPDGNVKLLDLGAAKDMYSGQGQQSQLVTKKGFSPLEQYTETGKIGPWTDVYALCATIYYCITGKMIPSALDRMNNPEISFPGDLAEPLSDSMREVLKAGLAVEAPKRIQSVETLLKCLHNNSVETVFPTASSKPSPTASSGVSKGRNGADKSKKIPIFAGAAAAAAVIIAVSAFGGGKEEKDSRAENVLELEESKESVLTVEKRSATNANLLNFSGSVEFDDEYQYFIGGDSALYVCTYNEEDSTFYVNDAEKVCDSVGSITLSDDKVSFLCDDDGPTSICRMNKDGSDIEQLYTVPDGRKAKLLQYVRFSDSREYLYFIAENERISSWGSLYRFDLAAEKIETVMEGDFYWYNLSDEAVYCTELTEGADGTKLIKAGLDGENPEELETDKNFTAGFIEEDALYLYSLRDEAFLVYDFDGVQKSGFEGFYNLDIDFDYALGYGDGWIYYTGGDENLHRVRANGTGDTILLEGHTAADICYTDYWIWFIEEVPTEKEHYYMRQAFYAAKDGSRLLEIKEPKPSWKLETARVRDFIYTESEDGEGVIIRGYTGDLTSLAIPDKIDGRTVEGIGEEAFEGSMITEIGLPQGVKYIEDNAFYQCGNLTFAGLPEGLERIGIGAFGECHNLKEIEFPESLLLIENLAFAETSLPEVRIPANVETIGGAAFAIPASVGIMDIEVSEDNPTYLSEDGVLFLRYENDKTETILWTYPSGRDGAYVIPEHVIAIAPYAFAHCRNLEEVIIPDNVILIGSKAFYDVSLTEINVSSGCDVKEDLGSDITIHYY